MASNHALAVYAPQLGAPSETFVRRHVESILPGRTAVFAEAESPEAGAGWQLSGPTLCLSQLRDGAAARYARVMGRKIRRVMGVAARRPHEAEVLRFLKRHGVQVVMGEYLDSSLPWLDVARRAGARFFAHAHGYDVSQRLRDPHWRRAYLRLAEADGVITVSELSRARLIDLGLQKTRIHVIPCGVDVPDLPRRSEGHSTLRCLAVGRMTAKKAPCTTLDAFRHARELVPGLELDFVGAGELMSTVAESITAEGLADCVTLHGSLPNDRVHALMADADIFLQHSVLDPATGDEEGLPVAILEAMAHGLPVVSTLHAGIPEAVSDGSTGYLVPEGDGAAMAERIVALARDPERARAMGSAGWMRARERFSWPRERADLLRVLGLSDTAAED